MKNDIQKEITEKIIASLEKGIAPWVRDWDTFGEGPINRATGKPYRGSNVIWLSMDQMMKGYSHNQWLTFKQAKELAVTEARAAGRKIEERKTKRGPIYWDTEEDKIFFGGVKKGEKASSLVVFFKPVVKTEVDENGDETTSAFRVLRYFRVFNVEQTTIAPLTPNVSREHTPIETAESVIKDTGATIIHGGDRAYYRASTDEIHLPLAEQFHTPAAYYATALHELVHWTGHESRLNRRSDKSKEGYAFEELVAELGSAFLSAHCGLEGELRHADYIGGWLKALKNDKTFIFKAAWKAAAAQDHILENEYEDDIQEAA